ncbi:phage holin family protein [Paracoccus aminophilus]|uniref:Phage holin family protein n=1 Tax=Paracoccus aminophilus JCM 7686 TaxID=1367847 RepID=S5XMY1_PARAH|nr:phage holin family protein [Paracoccus aminophilus]AGT08634.1 hypothetical protein JCM7686_1533 [Paracoccus aminophilus JCM 7686]
MLDYARRMKLAASDIARRAGVVAAAGILALTGLGFLLAALWTFLAVRLEWGPLNASLVIGAVFLILGLLLLVFGTSKRHEAPTAADLRAEVEERMSIATDVVLDRVSGRAERAIDKVRETAGDALEAAQSTAQHLADVTGNRVQSLVDSVSYRASRVADDVEAKASGLVRGADDMAERIGLTAERREKLAEGIDKARSSKLGTIAPVIGAFAIGITLANRFQSWRHGDDDEDDDQDEAYFDEDGYDDAF